MAKVIVDKYRYAEMLQAGYKLNMLHQDGVDSWEGYLVGITASDKSIMYNKEKALNYFCDEYEDLDVYVHNSIVTGIQNKINNHYKNNTLTEKDVKLLYEIFDEVEKLRIFVKEEDL